MMKGRLLTSLSLTAYLRQNCLLYYTYRFTACSLENMFTTRVFITNLNDNFHTYKVECLFNPSWIMGPRPLLMECMDSCLIVCKFKGFILHVHRSQSGFQHTNITGILT